MAVGWRDDVIDILLNIITNGALTTGDNVNANDVLFGKHVSIPCADAAAACYGTYRRQYAQLISELCCRADRSTAIGAARFWSAFIWRTVCFALRLGSAGALCSDARAFLSRKPSQKGPG